MDKVSLLVEGGALETERVDNVVDLDVGIIKLLLATLGGSVGTSVCRGVSVRNAKGRLIKCPAANCYSNIGNGNLFTADITY